MCGSEIVWYKKVTLMMNDPIGLTSRNIQLIPGSSQKLVPNNFGADEKEVLMCW